MVLLFGLCLPAIAAEESLWPPQNEYYNQFVGLRVPLPEDWHRGTPSEIAMLGDYGAQLMGTENASSEFSEKVLFMVSEHVFSDMEEGEFNPNLYAIAFNIRGHEDEVSSGSDYVNILRNSLAQVPIDVTISDTSKQQIGEYSLDRIDLEMFMEGVPMHQRQLAYVNNGYLIIIYLTAESTEKLDTLTKQMEGLEFSSVPESVDQSDAGESFREKSSIKASGGGSWKRYLIIGVIVFIVFGILGKH